jgi:3-polyprenyl-4-hydroxybenzoate decarboxylase
MPFRDFHVFLTALRSKGELFCVDRPVAPEPEVAKAIRQNEASAGFDLVNKNNGTRFSLAGGAYNSHT